MNEIEPEQRIYAVLAAIPSGAVVTYGQLAELAGLPRAARLVGRTLSKLPGDSTLPWHRVINASGGISLPQDSPGFERQKKRLQEEDVVVTGSRINLKKFRWQP
ncbi:MAG TPA: cysteine methyltransferase [Porticoccaceae bacterium]|jgi:methylated-DNA-protein-cysteine methyltransferase-like protein|nr:cysteine methyltransferase [Porticoccaceae bacterium]